jgi:hypothetical protein
VSSFNVMAGAPLHYRSGRSRPDPPDGRLDEAWPGDGARPLGYRARMRFPRTAAMLLACLVPACASAAPEVAPPQVNVPAASAGSTVPPPPEDPSAPTPYTAEQIRDATKVGRTYEFIIEKPDGPPERLRMKFVAVTAQGTTVESVPLDGTGKPKGEMKRAESTWAELRDHARYPKAGTTIEETTTITPAGTFACKRYTVVEQKPAGEERTVACFASDLPGPPVELRKEMGGQLVMTMSLLRHEVGN